MANITEAIYARLSSDVTLAGLVSDRITPASALTNTTLPYLVFEVTDSEPQLSVSGPTGLSKFTVDIATGATSEAEASAVLAAVRARLHGKKWTGVQGAFGGGQSISEAEDNRGYVGGETYVVWFSESYDFDPGDDENDLVVTQNVRFCGELLDCEGEPLELGGGSDKSYTHNQTLPATTWNVIHNLSKKPSVSVEDSAGTTIVPDIVYTSDNTLTVLFGSSVGGKVFCN